MIRRILNNIPPMYEIILIVTIFSHAIVIGNVIYHVKYKLLFHSETKNLEQYRKENPPKSYNEWIRNRGNKNENGQMDN